MAVRLDDQGIFEDAYPVAVASAVLDTLNSADALILGGDFWILEEGHFQPVYASWHFDDQDRTESVNIARQTFREPWVSPDWYVSFVWD